MYLIYLLAFISIASCADPVVPKVDPAYYDEVKNSRNFTGKVVLVTGSSSGIGEEISKLFSSLGAHVVVTGRKAAEIKAAAEEIQKLSPHGFKPLEVEADLDDSLDIERLVNETEKAFGRLDVLVNNAGIFLMAAVTDSNFFSTLDEFQRLDVRGTIDVVRQTVPLLTKSKGTIINISGILTRVPQKSMLAYELAKQSVEMATKVLALELAPQGIRVNSISPGSIQSRPLNLTDPQSVDTYNRSVKITPLGRIGLTSDVARGVAFLASSDAQFITGVDLPIDGGFIYNVGSGFMIGQ